MDEYESDDTDIEVDPDSSELLHSDLAMKRVRGGAAKDASIAPQRPVDGDPDYQCPARSCFVLFSLVGKSSACAEDVQ